jgi:PAS domain S-box-containing protein
VIGLSTDGTIETWAGAATRLFGYEADEVIGRTFDMLFMPADAERGLHQAELELACRAGRSEDDRWHRRKDGSRFWASGVVNPIHDRDGRHIGFAKLLRDRTDHRIRFEAQENRLQQLARQLESTQESLGTMVHELRNSLAPVVSAVRVIGRGIDEDLQRRMIGVVERQADVMRRVLADAGQRFLAQREPLHLQSMVLQDALRATVDALGFEARAKGIDLGLVLPSAPVAIEADPARVQQMVMNLLSNSIKYTGAQGHVTVSMSVEGEMAVVRVDDDGEGISAENLERVFDIFTREVADAAVPGYGIGLAVVRRLAWLHGGFVEARSPGKGSGSQFTLQLPLRSPRSSAAPP